GAGTFAKLSDRTPMNARAFALIVVAAWALSASAQRTTPPESSMHLPAISWTCPMHPDVVERTKGTCPKCRMDLVPVRLATVWTCPVHSVIEENTPGKCRICARDLVQATRSLTFTCAGH